jgi:hypothetical protein
VAIRDPFAGACRDAARGLRRLPAEVRKTTGRTVKTDVADPLAADVRGALAATGRQGARLVTTVKTRVNVEPIIVVGGARAIFSGGANGRQVIYGHEFGSGTHPQRAERLARGQGGRRGTRTRRTTAQFAGPGHHAVFGTFAAQADVTFNRWLEAIEPALQAWESGALDG